MINLCSFMKKKSFKKITSNENFIITGTALGLLEWKKLKVSTLY